MTKPQRPTPTVNAQFLRTVAEDLQHIGTEWADGLPEATLRRESTVLRRLLANDDLQRAWNMAGFRQKFHVVASRAESVLELPDASKLLFAMAGGAQYHGIQAALAEVWDGPVPKRPPSSYQPLEYQFSLSGFVSSLSIFARGTRVSREQVVLYVSTKLGGAHFDSSRDGASGPVFAALDNLDPAFQISVGDPPPLAGIQAIYFELLSIGQAVARAADSGRLIERIRQVCGA